MTLDIIIPTYNSENTIKNCLESILNQNIQNELIRVIIIDGQSSDNTLNIVQSYTNKLPMTIISEPDDGIYDAMNTGISICQADIIYFMGSDDSFYDSEVLKNVISHFKKDTVILWGDCHLLEKEQIKKQNFSKNQIFLNFINHQSVFYNSKFLTPSSFKKNFSVFADQVLTRKMLYSNYETSIYIPITIANYSLSGFSSNQCDYEFLKYNYMETRELLGNNMDALKHCNSTAINIITSLNGKKRYFEAFMGYFIMIYFNKKPLFIRTYLKSLFINFIKIKRL